MLKRKRVKPCLYDPSVGWKLPQNKNIEQLTVKRVVLAEGFLATSEIAAYIYTDPLRMRASYFCEKMRKVCPEIKGRLVWEVEE